MSFTPYEPEPGVFTAQTLSTNDIPDGWSVVSDDSEYRINFGGTTVRSVGIGLGTSVSVSAGYVGGALFVLVSVPTTTNTNHDLDVYLLSDDGMTGEIEDVPPAGLSLSGEQGGGMTLAFAPDESAYFVYVPVTGQNATAQHHVYRTLDGEPLCSLPQTITAAAQRRAEFVDDDGDGLAESIHVSIGAAETGCALARGCLWVGATDQPFPEAVVGTTTTTKRFELGTTGDCLEIDSIADAGPFAVDSIEDVTGTPVTLPTVIEPGDLRFVDVAFDPTAPGDFEEALAVTTSPADPDCADSIHCEGSARLPEPRIGFSQTSLGFGTVPVTDTATRTLTIRNDGDADLTVAIQAQQNLQNTPNVYTWGALNDTLNPGDEVTHDVQFAPTAAGGAQDTLTITSNDVTAPLASPHGISLAGTGCTPTPAIEAPPTAPTDFGPIQRGFRTVRTFTVSNPGSDELTFDARIDGATADGFGLLPSEGSVTDVELSRNYTVAPATGCGSVATGEGETVVAVGFHAVADPGDVDAMLVIDNHNDQAAPATFTYPLTAEVTEPIALDAALVLDRSGSMDEPSGERQSKAEAAVAAGDLFARLLRPDGADRVAAVRFNQEPDVFFPIEAVTADSVDDLDDAISTDTLDPSGSTSIAAGVTEAVDELETPADEEREVVHRAVVVLTDGKENVAYFDDEIGDWVSIVGGFEERPTGEEIPTQPLAVPPGVAVYGVAIGREADDVDQGRLELLSSESNGVYRVSTDLEGQHYFDLEKAFTRAFLDAVDWQEVLDPVSTLEAGETGTTEFDVVAEDASLVVVVYDKAGRRLPFSVRTPTDEKLDTSFVPPGYGLRVGSAPTARFVEVTLPRDDPERYVGRWAVEVTHPGEVCVGTPSGFSRGSGSETKADEKRAEAWRPGFVPRACKESDDPVEYSLLVGVGSDVRLAASVTPGIVHVGDPIQLSATLTDVGFPLAGWTVTVEAESPSGVQHSLTLADDGAHGDGDADDGEYARAFTHTAEAGSYEFTFRARGKTRDGDPTTRETTLAKHVEGRKPVAGGEPGDGSFDECCKRLTKAVRELAVSMERRKG